MGTSEGVKRRSPPVTAENKTMNQKRTPAGIPTGGEFAANEHDEAASSLAVERDAYGYRRDQRFMFDGDVLSPEEALERWSNDHEIAWHDLIEGMDEDESQEAIFSETHHQASAITNLAALRSAARYNGVDESKLDLPQPAESVYTYDEDEYEGSDLVEHLMRRGDLSPAARDMPVSEVLHQYNEANALDESDDEHVGIVYEKEEQS